MEKDIYISHEHYYRIYCVGPDYYLGVMVGGFAMYEKKLRLNSEEVRRFEEEGKKYADHLARDFRKLPKKFEGREWDGR